MRTPTSPDSAAVASRKSGFFIGVTCPGCGGDLELEEDFSIGFDVSVQSDLACIVENAEIHFFGVKVDSAIKFVLFGVKSHWVSSFLWLYGFLAKPSLPFFRRRP